MFPPSPAGTGGSSRRYRLWLEAPLRRPWLALGPLLLALLGAFALASILPTRHEASALVRGRWEAGDDEVARRLGTDAASRRLRALRQQLLSPTATETVLAELAPYPAGKNGEGSGAEAAAKLLTSVGVEARGEDVFAIRYVHADAKMAALVPNRLAGLLVAGSEPERTLPPAGHPRDLETRLQAARKVMEEAEAELRRLREGGVTAPEVPPAPVAGATAPLAARSRALELDLTAARARADALRGALSALEAQPRPAVPSELDRLRAERAELRQRYTDEHPDVDALNRRIRRLEAVAPPSMAPTPGPEAESLRAQLEAAEAEVEALSRRKVALAAETARSTPPGRVARNARPTPDPALQRDRLARAFDEARVGYEALRDEWEAAETRSRLGRTAVVRFELLEAATVPSRPDFPDRTLFVLVGLALGLVLGVGASVVTELRDRTIKDAEDLAGLLAQPVLAEIPLIKGRRGRS